MATLTMQPIGPSPAPAAQEDKRRVVFLLRLFLLFCPIDTQRTRDLELSFEIFGVPGLDAGRRRTLLWMLPI
jgi:hypothetical protein